MPMIPFADIPSARVEMHTMLAEADRNGAPNAKLLRVLAHRPELMQGFYRLWTDAFNQGVLDHRIKELVRIKVDAVGFGCDY